MKMQIDTENEYENGDDKEEPKRTKVTKNYSKEEENITNKAKKIGRASCRERV